MTNEIIVNIPRVLWLLLIPLAVGLFGAWKIKKEKTRKMTINISLAFAGVVLLYMVALAIGFPGWEALNKPLLNQSGTYNMTNGTLYYTYSTAGVNTNTVNPSGSVSVQTYQPTATYSTVDHWASTSIGGTSYYKAGNEKATTTAISNVDPTKTYQYWVSNATTYVKPKSFVGSGTNTVVNNEAYRNGSMTITSYDIINSQSSTNGAYNTSLSTGSASVKFTVKGSATTSNMPLGGVLVLETNSTATQISCSGDGISSPSGKFHVTYLPTYLTSRYVMYDVAEGYDRSADGLIGVTKTFNCDFVSATNPGSGSPLIVKFIPANYYYVNSDGSFALDTEQFLNGLSTRTGLGGQSLTNYWGA